MLFLNEQVTHFVSVHYLTSIISTATSFPGISCLVTLVSVLYLVLKRNRSHFTLLPQIYWISQDGSEVEKLASFVKTNGANKEGKFVASGNS